MLKSVKLQPDRIVATGYEASNHKDMHQIGILVWQSLYNAKQQIAQRKALLSSAKGSHSGLRNRAKRFVIGMVTQGKRFHP